ncbi:hypothetical protein [Thermococcus thioreducens]|uniref:Uncharacterized protein n=1 Tax=Thermococcus thioreducens TaxID=277988 RepID=A0A0Q2UPG9_9EURY|nr:hypothetical protein [Thermococcus thioreducens]ASJ11663.1 hypothetical protein A3L14_01620 [Thermococcus thioreducens]KQH82600.1 hypothetical protein AMR53_04815 [Thermococcus thioreducens]SEW16013.1 hypothetical protein SAMN05216170_1957 [Thermococcus thioreducens]
MEEVKKLVQEAYEFGYFVGYKGHSEWAEWVRERRERLYARAQELGVYELVKNAYNRGKLDGAKKREEEIRKGLGKEGAGEQRPGPKTALPEGTEEETGEVEFARFLETTRLFLPPDLLDTMKHLRPPKMLRIGH